MASPKRRRREFEALLKKKLPGCQAVAWDLGAGGGWRVVVDFKGRRITQNITMTDGLGRQDLNAVAQIKRKAVEP